MNKVHCKVHPLFIWCTEPILLTNKVTNELLLLWLILVAADMEMHLGKGKAKELISFQHLKQEKKLSSHSPTFTLLSSKWWRASDKMWVKPWNPHHHHRYPFTWLQFNLSRQGWKVTLVSGVTNQLWHQWYHRGPYNMSFCVWHMLLMDQNSSHEGKSHKRGRIICAILL